MPGGRKTHKYPYGKPFPLIALDCVGFFILILWLFLGSRSWMHAAGVIALFIGFAVIYSKLHDVYERSGQAVPIPDKGTVVKFTKGMPRPLFALRIAFLVCAAAVFVFGIPPLADKIAIRGMIGAVMGAILVGFLNVAVERYYVHTGRGQDIPVGVSRSGSANTS